MAWGQDDFWKGFHSKNGANALIGLGTGLLQGNTFAKGLAAGGQGFMQGAALDQQYADEAEKKAKEEEMRQRYAQVLSGWGGEYSDLADGVLAGGIDPAQAYMTAWERRYKSAGGGADERFFGNVVPMQDAEGNIVLGQASNMGNWQPLQGADGYSPAPTTKQIDTGTEIITTDIYGNELYRTPKQNRQAAYETGYGGVEGKADAENAALAESVQSKLPGLRTVIDELTSLADTATYTQSGQAMDAVKRELGLPVGQGAIDRASYIAIVDNQVLPLLRDTFGAAFTQKEGESLRATLGDPNKSPAEKKAILNAFIAQKERDVAAMHSRFSGQGGEIDDILSGYGL